MPGPARLAASTLVLASLLAVPISSEARTWHVPGDVGTIAAALDSAAGGDVVEIACGTYLENDLVLDTPAVTLRSATGQPDCVTIDASGGGRVLRIASATGIVVEGLTLTGAFAGNYAGGGLAIHGSSAVVRDCVVRDNVSDAPGGGVWIHESGPVTLQRCVVDQNEGARGGGLEVGDATVVAEECSITGNVAAEGGGVSVRPGGDLRLDDATVLGNTAPDGAEGYVETGAQAWLHCCETDSLAWVQLGTVIWDDEGCDVAARPTSWGAVKARYR